MGTDLAPVVRPVQPSDTQVVSRLLGTLGYPAESHQVAARLARMPSDFAAWVAETGASRDDVAVVGLAVARVSWRLTGDRPIAQLLTLVTDEHHRGSGAGSALLAMCEDWGRDRGATGLLVLSGTQRRQAHEWYARRGFDRTGVRLVKAL